MHSRTAAVEAMTLVLDAELQPEGKPVGLAGMFARALIAGAVAVKGLVGDDDVDELVEEVSAALPDVGFERGDMDGMDQYWAHYAYAVGDELAKQSALIDIAESWAGGELCDHPDPVVRSAARRAYIDGRFEAPWN